MFLCEILTEQQQALPKVLKAPPQHVHVHVQQPAPPKEKKEPEPVQQEQPGQYGDEYDPELDGMEMQEAPPFQEILPMKRYYLIGRLKELKSQLDQTNIQNTDFNIIMKFINNLSYNSLVSLSSGIIPVVEDQLARLTKNVQSES
jgi:hypothetical protein